jgi:hypothetical protein
MINSVVDQNLEGGEWSGVLESLQAATLNPRSASPLSKHKTRQRIRLCLIDVTHKPFPLPRLNLRSAASLRIFTLLFPTFQAQRKFLSVRLLDQIVVVVMVSI